MTTISGPRQPNATQVTTEPAIPQKEIALPVTPVVASDVLVAGGHEVSLAVEAPNAFFTPSSDSEIGELRVTFNELAALVGDKPATAPAEPFTLAMPVPTAVEAEEIQPYISTHVKATLMSMNKGEALDAKEEARANAIFQPQTLPSTTAQLSQSQKKVVDEVVTAIVGQEKVEDEIILPAPAMISAEFAGMDVEQLVQLVMMQCSQSATQDLKDVLAQMQAANKKKQGQAKLISYLKEQQAKADSQMHAEYNRRAALPESDAEHIDTKSVSYDQFSATQNLLRTSQAPTFNLSPNHTLYPKAPKQTGGGTTSGTGGVSKQIEITSAADITKVYPGLGQEIADWLWNVHTATNTGKPVAEFLESVVKLGSDGPSNQKAYSAFAESLKSTSFISQLSPGAPLQPIAPSELLKQLLDFRPSGKTAVGTYDTNQTNPHIEQDFDAYVDEAGKHLGSKRNEIDAAVISYILDAMPAGCCVWNGGSGGYVGKPGNEHLLEALMEKYKGDPDVLSYVSLSIAKASKDAQWSLAQEGGAWSNASIRKGLGGKLFNEAGGKYTLNADKTQAKAWIDKLNGWLTTNLGNDHEKLASTFPKANVASLTKLANGAPGIPSNAVLKGTTTMGQVSKNLVDLINQIPDAQPPPAPTPAPKKTDQVEVAAHFDGLDEVSMAQLGNMIEDAQNEKDATGDLTDELQLKIQMAMDRRQKAMETLSNLMKKISDTTGAIVGNMK